MSRGVELVLLSLALFEVKHFLCDYVLQTTYLYSNKGIYGHRAGFIHAGLHAVTSLPALLIISRDVSLLAAVLMAEFIIHYHIDWLKSYLEKRYDLTVTHRLYWVSFGADQLIHQATYVAVLAVVAQVAGI